MAPKPTISSLINAFNKSDSKELKGHREKVLSHFDLLDLSRCIQSVGVVMEEK